MDVSGHYNEEYFEWQKEVGEFGGKANLFKFRKYIAEGDNVLDFGSGGGYLLKNIHTKGEKIGIEINQAGRAEAEKGGIRCFDSITKAEDSSIDVLISNHALEHVDNPMNYINEFKRVTKPGGKIVLCVPHETGKSVNSNSRDMHLYTWSPQNLYNLLSINGLKVVECRRLTHAWPPYYLKIQKLVGWKNYHRLCILYSLIKRKYQTIIVAEK